MSKIMQSLPLYVAAMSREFDTKVTFGGNEAYCSPQNLGWIINIPVFDTENEETCAAAFAYALHETGHVTYTDFDVLKAMISDHSNQKLSITKDLNNILEDVYIEKMLSRKLKGAYSRLSKMRHWLHAQNPNTVADIKQSESKNLIIMAIYYIAFKMGGYDVYDQSACDVKAELSVRFGDAFLTGLESLLRECRNLSSSKDVLVLTESVFEYIKNELDKQQQQQQQQQGDSQDQNQDSQDQGNGDSDNQDQDQDSQDQGNGDSDSDNQDQGDDSQDQGNGDSDSDSQDQGDDSQDQGNGDSDNQSDNGQQSNQFDDSQSDGDQQSGQSQSQSQSNQQQTADNIKNLQDILDGNVDLPDFIDAGKVLADKLSDQSKDDQTAGLVDFDSAENQSAGSNLVFKELLRDDKHIAMITTQAERQTVFVRQRIQGLIAAKQRVQVSRKSSGKRVISQAGFKLAMGDNRVFRQEVKRKLTNTAITILIDDSGSMNGELGRMAAIATQAIVQALNNVKFVKTSVFTFGTNVDRDEIYTVKGWDESPYRCAQRLSSHLSVNGAYTPLLSGLWGGLQQVSQRSEERKIIMVITDGEPDSRHECATLINGIRNSNGVEVFGIGIGDADQLVKPLFGDKHAVSVSDIDNLANEIFKLAENILIN